jgi:4-amino-4-deoxy-L-arabinose transferase-like glycosyltransferase
MLRLRAAPVSIVNKPLVSKGPPTNRIFVPMSDRSLIIALLALLVVTASGSVLDVMEVDAAQYAGIARDMLSHQHRPDDATWLKLYYRGNDYLDKPPLLFLLSALSFKVFGVSNWSYKLPSILYAFLGLYATYRFSKLYHSEAVARTAALMFGGSAAFVLMTNDVRTDTILTASIMAAIWMGAAWIEQRRSWQLIGCSFALASGMLVKGPMGLMAPVLALAGQVVFTRRWSAMWDARVLMVPIVLGLLLLPMCIGLYQQHGTHGLRFYFWEQSFGRITGENRWKDDSSVLFFTHEVLWQLLPWTVFVLAGLWRSVRSLVKRVPLPEYASISGILTVFLALSLSKFKLPHYLYVLVPLFAVQGAWAWHTVFEGALMRVHKAILFLVWVLALALAAWSFPDGGVPFIALLAMVGILFFWRMWRCTERTGWFIMSFQVMVAVAITLNAHFYPSLLRYQAAAQAGKWAASKGLDIDHFYGMQVSGSALDFYAGYPVRWLSDVEEAGAVIAPGVAIYTDGEQLGLLEQAGLLPKERILLKDYPVQLLGIDMLSPDDRPGALRGRYLLLY